MIKWNNNIKLQKKELSEWKQAIYLMESSIIMVVKIFKLLGKIG